MIFIVVRRIRIGYIEVRMYEETTREMIDDRSACSASLKAEGWRREESGDVGLRGGARRHYFF